MAYPGISLAIMIGVALGTAIYYYLKSDNQRHNSYSYQRKITYEPPLTTDTPSSSTSLSNRTNRNTRKRKPKECVICFESLTKENSSLLICGHEFHYNCIKRWFQESNSTKCPLCCKSNDKECFICYEPLVNNKHLLRCGHIFHTYCIQKWFKESKTCPLLCPQ